ncbi:hypothetical protein [Nonomuraea cavernae]
MSPAIELRRFEGALGAALAAAKVPSDSPEQALARQTIELWRVGDS